MFPLLLPPVFFIGSTAILVSLDKKIERLIPSLLAGTIIISFLLVGVRMLPILDSRPIMDFGKQIALETGKESRVGIYGKDCNEIIFYARKPVKEIRSPGGLKDFSEREGDGYCVIAEKHYRNISPDITGRFKIIGKRHRWKDIGTAGQFIRFVNDREEFKDWVYLIKTL